MRDFKDIFPRPFKKRIRKNDLNWHYDKFQQNTYPYLTGYQHNINSYNDRFLKCLQTRIIEESLDYYMTAQDTKYIEILSFNIPIPFRRR